MSTSNNNGGYSNGRVSLPPPTVSLHSLDKFKVKTLYGSYSHLFHFSQICEQLLKNQG